MSLKITTLSLKINVIHLFSAGTFGPGPRKKWKTLIFFYLRVPAQKVLDFLKLILFFRFLSKLPDAFYILIQFVVVLEV